MPAGHLAEGAALPVGCGKLDRFDQLIIVAVGRHDAEEEVAGGDAPALFRAPQHDLAAEWSRFQRLKEIADQPAQWASYATQPLWLGALRMLGSFLLRESINGRSAWDDALEQLETQQNTLAADILLDALCLDPLAEQCLMARADLLLKDNGQFLNRLLKRFQHIGTAPGGGTGESRGVGGSLMSTPATLAASSSPERKRASWCS